MRAISSIKSAGMETSLVARKEGTVTLISSLVLPFLTSNLRDFRMLIMRVLGTGRPMTLWAVLTLNFSLGGVNFQVLTSIKGVMISALGQSCLINSQIRLTVSSVRAGSRDFSKRWAASVRMPSLVAVFRSE